MFQPDIEQLNSKFYVAHTSLQSVMNAKVSQVGRKGSQTYLLVTSLLLLDEGGRGSENSSNLVEVIYGWPHIVCAIIGMAWMSPFSWQCQTFED